MISIMDEEQNKERDEETTKKIRKSKLLYSSWVQVEEADMHLPFYPTATVKWVYSFWACTK